MTLADEKVESRWRIWLARGHDLRKLVFGPAHSRVARWLIGGGIFLVAPDLFILLLASLFDLVAGTSLEARVSDIEKAMSSDSEWTYVIQLVTQIIGGLCILLGLFTFWRFQPPAVPKPVARNVFVTSSTWTFKEAADAMCSQCGSVLTIDDELEGSPELDSRILQSRTIEYSDILEGLRQLSKRTESRGLPFNFEQDGDEITVISGAHLDEPQH